MPGLIGFCGRSLKDQPEEFLGRMARALESEDRFKVDLYNDRHIGLGRVSLGITNPEPQPIWNEDGNLCIVMEGEIYDYAAQKQLLIERGHHFKTSSDAEFVLHLYEEFGEAFAVKLNGAFVVAIWDTRSSTLVLANDRLGLYPLYYAHVNADLTFGSGVRALLVDPDLPRSVDLVAINQFLVFDHVLDDRTLLNSVRLLPQASLLTFSDNRLNIRPYWTLKYPGIYEKRSEDAYIEQLLYFLRQAVVRQAPGDFPAGLLLSGGLDSRVLLALLRDGPADDAFHTFTWGIPGCDDARFAKAIATKVGTQHRFFELKPDWLLDLAEEGVRITDGLGNVVNLHALAISMKAAQCAQIIYKGFMGDAMMGFSLTRHFWADYDPETACEVHLQAHHSLGCLNYNQAEQKQLLTDAFRQRVGSAVYDAYQAGMLRSGVKQLGNQRLYFDLTQRVPRMTINGVEVVRIRAIVRLPFCDNDLLDFVLTVPPGLHFERHLIKTAFARTYPKLPKLPLPRPDYQ